MLHARKFPCSCSLLSIAVRIESDILRSIAKGNDMKQILAACVAIAALWVIDIEFNNGRYSEVVQRTFKYILAR